MSLEPRHTPVSAMEQARSAAERQARSFSGGLVLAIAMLLAIGAIGLFVVLDYQLDQDPHRLVKIALGASLLAAILMKPLVGLFAVPLLTPFILQLPKMPIPGVNTLNILMGSVFFSFALTRMLQRVPMIRNGAVGRVLIAMTVMAGVWIFRGAAFPTGYEYNAAAAGLELFRASMTFSIFFVTLAMIHGAKGRRLMAWAVVLGLLAEALVTIKLGRNFRGRASGSIDQPNDLGAFLAMFTAVSAALIFGVRNLWAKLVLAGTAAAGIVGVVLSVSRGGILALCVALGFVSIRSSRMLTVLLVAAALTSPAWAPDYLKERVVGTEVSSEGSDEVELESSSADRVETWRAIGQLVMDHPLEGVGFAGLNSVLSLISTSQSLDIKDSAHNTYLRFLGEMGIFGLGLFLWTLWTCWSLGRTAGRRAKNAFDRQLALGLSAATLALAISCMFGDRFFQVTISGNFWVLAALVTDSLSEGEEASA